MDVFRRLTNPTLKKLYRFVLKRLVGRFLEDDIALEQIDVQVRAGRVELTDINVNVSALAKLLPQLSCRISSARIGKVRVEISYTKLLTESLAFFLDDVHVHIEPPNMEDSDKRSADREVGISTSKQRVEEGGAIMTSMEGSPFNRENTVEPGAGHAEDANLSDGVGDESREGLDFLARWIDQITSKVKVMVHNIRITVGQASRSDGENRARNYDEDRARHRGTHPFLEVRCSFLRWCDETPDSPVFVAEGPQPSQSLKNWDGSGKRGKSPSDIHLSQKALTAGQISVDWYGNEGRPGREVFKISSPTSIAMKKKEKRSTSRLAPIVELDVDVSFRHINVSLGAEDCEGLLQLSKLYLPPENADVASPVETHEGSMGERVKPLFREEFWYFSGLQANEAHSEELNFDTLSSLLEQYAGARARLAEVTGEDPADLDDLQSSSGQSDVFFDCVDESEKTEWDVADDSPAEGESDGDSTNVRIRIAGIDVMLSTLGEQGDRRRATPAGERSEIAGNNASGDYSTSQIVLQMRHMVQTVRCVGSRIECAGEVANMRCDFIDGSSSNSRAVRLFQVMDEVGATPCFQVVYSTSTRPPASTPFGEVGRTEELNPLIDIQCVSVSAAVHNDAIALMSDFLRRAVPQERPAQTNSREDQDGTPSRQFVSCTSQKRTRTQRGRVSVKIPKIVVRVPALAETCSSEAYLALVSSVRNNMSPVGWERKERLEQVTPELVLEIEEINALKLLASAGPPSFTLECSRVRCQMMLPSRTKPDECLGLYFLDAHRPTDVPVGDPLRLEFGPSTDVRTGGKPGARHSAEIDLKFLHTWEPNDCVENGLNESGSSTNIEGQKHGAESDSGKNQPDSNVLLCVLPRLNLELSRLEVVVLADMLQGLLQRPDPVSADEHKTLDDLDSGTEVSASTSVEVLVEARGATFVLHEAAAYAEDPGPHSFILNLGDACLRLGGNGISDAKEKPAPLFSLSSGDVCLHETLRISRDGRSRFPHGQLTAPVLFRPGDASYLCPSVEDIPGLGFVSNKCSAFDKEVPFLTFQKADPLKFLYLVPIRSAAQIPVLYQTKWAKGISPLAAELTLAVSEAGNTSKTITATLNLYDVSLRHTVTSSWLPRFLSLVIGDVPAGRGAQSNPGESSDTGGNLTKMFITVFNGVVDYTPPVPSGSTHHANSSGTKGRAVFPIGVLRVSSNMVAGAQMQGFKVVIRDIALHMFNRSTDYRDEDLGLCRGALGTRRPQLCFGRERIPPSVQEYLERSRFVQIATLNFLDAFIRTRSQVMTPADSFAAIELWMGTLHVYTCQDSLRTCQNLLGEWWDLMSECRAPPLHESTTSVGQFCKEDRMQGEERGEREDAVTSLLDDVEQNAFLPGGRKQLPGGNDERQGGANNPAPEDEGRHKGPEAVDQQSLVIEDYYCVSVKPSSSVPDADDAPQQDTTVVEEFGGAKEFGDVCAGQAASFLSEEGPAQWLATPNPSLDRNDSLSMQTAGDTSESEGDEAWDINDKYASSGMTRPSSTYRRSKFGFNLPAPIEIELESRYASEGQEEKEHGAVGGSSPSPSPRQRVKAWEGKASSEVQERGTIDEDFSMQEVNTDKGSHVTQREFPSHTGVPHDDDVTTQRPCDSIMTVSGGKEDTTAPDGVVSPEYRHVPRDAKLNDSSSVEMLHREQEAFWLGRPPGGNHDETFHRGNHNDDEGPQEFRVYPHYIPIPVSTEASSLPFVSGQPLVPLGDDEKEEGNDVNCSKREHKLQLQLAIHDLSVCWRLFKGNDWSDETRIIDNLGRVEFGARGGGVPVEEPNIGALFEGPARRKDRSTEAPRGYTDAASGAFGDSKPRRVELLDALLENYQDNGVGHEGTQKRRRSLRQPKVELLHPTPEPGAAPARRTGRDTSCMLEIFLEHCGIRLDHFHPGPPPSLLSNLLLTIKDIQASDTLTSSRPRKTLHHWRDDVHHPREYQQKMVMVRMTARSPSDHYCPGDAPLGNEIMLKVRILPVRLSFGQHTVDFIRSFVGNDPPKGGLDGSGDTGSHEVAGKREKRLANPSFVSCCDVGACKVKIDYQPRAIKVKALQNGDYLELLNLFPLEGVHLTLKKLVLTGVSGWDGVTQLLLQSWVQDITSNQLHSFLAGTTAVRPLVTVGKGAADLVLLPVEQYRRDGRVLRGLRKGTESFLRAITVETLHTSHRMASFVARTLDDIVAQPGSRGSLRRVEYYDEQPTGVLDSLEQAYDALVKEVQVAAQTIIAIPYEEREEVLGPHGRSYVRSVARALPVAVLRPVVGASEAISCTLLGFRNYVSPVIRKEEEGRWS